MAWITSPKASARDERLAWQAKPISIARAPEVLAPGARSHVSPSGRQRAHPAQLRVGAQAARGPLDQPQVALGRLRRHDLVAGARPGAQLQDVDAAPVVGDV